MTPDAQPALLADVPPLARYMTFRLGSGVERKDLTERLAALQLDARHVLGLGPSVVVLLGGGVDDLRELAPLAGPGAAMPSTPAALWCWLRGDDRGELLHAGRALARALAPALELVDATDAFRYGSGRDLSGYEDGTENPTGSRARVVALRADGSSLVAVQKWVHDLDAFEAMAAAERDATIGRRIRDNEEIEDAPESAHVKRAAQESFAPEAFVLRRSMPWADACGAGLMFVAFGATLDPFEALARRMVGLEDGLVDALFRFTRPVTGAAFWCPPVDRGALDLRALGSGG